MEKAFRITSIINIVLGGGLLVVAGLGYLLDSLKLIILIIAIFGTIFIISGIKGLQYKKNTIELSIGSDFICSLYCTLLFILMLDGTLILFLIFFIVHFQNIYFSIALNAAACAVIPRSEASLSIEDAPKNPSISGTFLIT